MQGVVLADRFGHGLHGLLGCGVEDHDEPVQIGVDLFADGVVDAHHDHPGCLIGALPVEGEFFLDRLGLPEVEQWCALSDLQQFAGP